MEPDNSRLHCFLRNTAQPDMTTNTARQTAYKERMRKAGFQQVTIWIQPKKKAQLKKYAELLRSSKVDMEML